MLFKEKELEVLENVNCYKDKLSLTKSEIDYDEMDVYTNNNDYWDISLCDWFTDFLNERIYTITLKNGKELYFFDNSNQEIDCDVEELLNKLFDNYDIQDPGSFDEVIVDLQDQFRKIELNKADIELLKRVYAYNDLYDLAEKHGNEEYLEEYIASFSNLSMKFEDWFFDNEPRCTDFNCITFYLYVDLDKMFYPKDKLEIINRLKELFNMHNITDYKDFEEFKNKYVEE